MKTVAVLILVAIVLLAGCNSLNSAATQAPSVTQTPATQTPTGKSAETGQEVQIVLKRSGGFAGVKDSWSITSDGHITSSDGRESQVSEASLSEAVNELEKLGFFEMERSYAPKNTCCDRFTYKLEVIVNGKSHSVTALEGAQEAPPEMWEAIQVVTKLLQGSQ